MMIDPKAKKILFNTYWSSTGLKRERVTSEEDFTYAKHHGTMFDNVKHNHSSLFSWLSSEVSKIDQASVGQAFVSSLSSRRVESRSILSSYTYAQNIVTHNFDDHSGSIKNCGVCGSYFGETEKSIDLNILSFERLKWGGVRLTDPEYVAFDIQEFAKVEFTEPAKSDYKLLAQILDKADNISPLATPNDLQKALSGVFKSNKSEREVVIQVLGISGILQPATHPGFHQEFTPAIEREDPPHSKNDWEYPVCWWKGSDGVNWDAVAYHFPDF